MGLEQQMMGECKLTSGNRMDKRIGGMRDRFWETASSSSLKRDKSNK